MSDNNGIKISELDQKVKDLGLNPADMMFISDSQDVTAIKENLPEFQDYDSFFVIIRDGDYEFLAGIEGIVPFNYKFVEILIS